MPSLAEQLIALSPHDRREIEMFRRFLGLGEPAPVPGGKSDLLHRYPGWVFYCLGVTPLGEPGKALLAPPEGYDDVPMTAWTFPG